MSEPRTILIVHNPKAGATDRTELLQGLAQKLAACGFVVDFVENLALVEGAVQQLTDSGRLRLVVAAGGDGTVAAVAQRVSPQTCLAVFPLGTENLLAKWLGATCDLNRFAQAILENQSRCIDAVLANDKLALITIGVGFDAEVVRQVQAHRTGHITKWNYAWPIWRAFWTYRFPQLLVTVERKAESPRELESPEMTANLPTTGCGPAFGSVRADNWAVCWLFVANLPNYGGGLSLSPQANPSDGWLDLAMFRRGGRLRGLVYAACLAWGRQAACRDFLAVKATSIRVESPLPTGFQVDGDYGGPLPLQIEILPNRVRLLSFPAKRVPVENKNEST